MTNQQSVVELRRKVNEMQKVLNLDIGNWDPRTRSGMEGRQNKVKQELPALKFELAKKILNNSTVMLIMRDVGITPDIIKEAKANPEKVLLLDFLSTEKWLVKTIYGDKVQNGYAFNSETVNRMNVLIGDEVGGKIQAQSIPLLVAKSSSYGVSTTREDIINKMSDLMFSAYDVDLKKYLFNVLISEGIYDRMQNDEVAVFIINVPQNFTQAFSSYAGKTIVVTEDPTAVGALVIDSTSSAAELVGAVTKAQSLVNKRAKGAAKRKQEDVATQQDPE